MSPQAQSTTLSSASSEIDDELGAPKKKTGKIVAVVGGLAAAAVAVVFLTQGKTEEKPKAPVAAMPAPAPTPAPSPPAKTTVMVRFEAMPSGTHVFRKTDGKDMGAAPLELKLAQKGGAADYVLRKDGYKELPVTADLRDDNTINVALEKVPEPVVAKPEPESKKKPSSGRKGGGGGKKKGGGLVPDEDGLATPSF
jgi:hypothetical protein